MALGSSNELFSSSVYRNTIVTPSWDPSIWKKTQVTDISDYDGFYNIVVQSWKKTTATGWWGATIHQVYATY